MAETSEDRILFLLKSRGPQSTASIARRLGMTSVGARKHLLRLQGQDLVGHEDRREAVGRPKRYWALTADGHARFPDTHSHLTLELLRSLRKVFGARGLDRLIADREAETLAGYRSALRGAEDLAARLRRLTRLRSEEGYMAEVRRERDGTFLLVENHCPICAAATECQGLCRSELAIFQAVLGDQVTVTRVEHIPAGARRCAYRVAPRTEAAPSEQASDDAG